MIPYLARLLDISMNNNAILGDCKKSYSDFHLQRRRSISSWKLQTSQLNLGGLQATGASYSRKPKTSLGNEWVVI